MKTEIEEKAALIVPDWVNKFYELTTNNKPLSSKYVDKIASCRECYAGDFRSKLGLSRLYWDETTNHFCDICNSHSMEFYKVYKYAYPRQMYLLVLTSFLKHMKEAHGYESTGKKNPTS